ncbi:MAG: DUF255 domain-containing protein [Gammaproteobacteria bacterium]|nr:DUF255 domain-containing protein [Gammaproteobacteria bacterium]
MKTPLRSAIRVLLSLALCLGVTYGSHALTNQLEDHPSPYLALHASDPVAWQDWQQSIVTQAKSDQRLIYLSIGYFSCHWCHVMQRESYKDPAIAKFLNANFIPVKVDRELEPALDARMIEFVEATQGRGGWPLNVFLTPDGYPLYATLYLPRENFMEVLTRIHEIWTNDKQNLRDLARTEAAQGKGPGAPSLKVEDVAIYVGRFLQLAEQISDDIHGGFGEQSKFPSAPQLGLLLDLYARKPDPELGTFLTLTLDQMAGNGLLDQLGGGFFRYTVDPDWETPHFEKMLYDNALLSRLYLRASRVLDQPSYEAVARRTLDFMISDMAAPTGAMVASFSAVDDRDVEGGYYLWSETELVELLSDRERQVLKLAWRMTGAPPFEEGYLPMRGDDSAQIARQTGFAQDEVDHVLGDIERRLLQVRRGRGLPVDDKLLAGWNGLALTGLADAARVTGMERYRLAAGRIRDYLVGTLWNGKELRRAVSGGRAVGRASIEDYAYVAQGLLAWAQLSEQASDFAAARSVIDQAWSRFYGAHGWRRAEDSFIVAESTRDALLDGPMPSPSGLVAKVSLELARHFSDESLKKQALGALNASQNLMREQPFWLPTHLSAMLDAVTPDATVMR